ncbi:Glycosyl transferase [Macleaya cordata]|uniref:Hexosyltransferase n=1 Tax=Macleaya cordata TaxID=56857 RepID=A0A200Q581_MACCD|nr:Glycosyl transferase [Macleaya cordata]
MKFYIFTKGRKRVTISSSSSSSEGRGRYCFWEVMKVKASSRRRLINYRSVLPTLLLILAIILPFLFIRAAYLALESASYCSSLDCIGRRLGTRFFDGSDISLRLTSEIARALIEAKEENLLDERGGIDGSHGSFNDLVADMTSNRQDIKSFASKTKATLLKMERSVQAARQQESMYKHLASYGVPKSMHCLSLRLAEEYSSNVLARSPLPPPEFVSRLTNASYHHLALLTDNVLAASIVVSSTVTNSAYPNKLVFHVVTDRKTYAPMHAWFALNPVAPAVVEVKGLHQLDWPPEVNIKIKETLEIHRSIGVHYHNNFNSYKERRGDNDKLDDGDLIRKLEQPLSPSYLSLINFLRIYLPELFPELNKIILLDDDVIVQNDLSPLWELDLNGKVNSAVFSSLAGNGEGEKEYYCSGQRYGDYLNFSNPTVSARFEYDRRAWLYGMNVFDLKAWRRTNITQVYHSWLKLNLNSGFTLWHPGALPPALIAFEGQVHPIDPSWHVVGLGSHQPPPELGWKILEVASVLHFSGPAKPWLEIGFPELRSLWNIHVNYSSEYLRRCKIMA